MVVYGITTSRAHYWAHVCAHDASIYIYPRRAMIRAIADRGFPSREIATAKGHIVPVAANTVNNGGIIIPFNMTYEWFADWGWHNAKSDDALGAMAEAAFEKACAEHRVTFPVRTMFHRDVEIQHTGRDYRCDLGAPHVDCEVKADYQGGIWGTGNLFVQTHELRHRHEQRLAHRSHPPAPTEEA